MLLQLHPKFVARLALASKALRELTSNEGLWETYCVARQWRRDGRVRMKRLPLCIQTFLHLPAWPSGPGPAPRRIGPSLRASWAAAGA